MNDLAIRAFVGNFPNMDGRSFNLRGGHARPASLPLEIPDVYIISVAALSATRIVCLTYPYFELSTYDLIGGVWVHVGHFGDGISSDTNARIFALSSNRVVFCAPGADEIATFEWDGVDWYPVGNAYSFGGLVLPHVAVISPTEILVSPDASQNVTFLTFDGTDWNNVTDFSPMAGDQAPMCAMSATRIAVLDFSKQWLQAWDFVDLSLTEVGSTYAFDIASFSQIVRIDDNRVLVASGNDLALLLFTFNGSTWTRKDFAYPFLSFDLPYLCSLSAPDAAQPPFALGFGASKKLGDPEKLDIDDVGGIYQMRKTRRGKVPIRMRFYVPTNPESVPQQANRTKFAAAMAAWQDLTTEEKQAYDIRARKRQMFGRNLFIREWYPLN